MIVKVIDFEVKRTLNLPESKEVEKFYVSKYPEDLKTLDERTPLDGLEEGEVKIYHRIRLRDKDKREEYLVNFEDAKAVMPILQGMVNTQTTELREENYKLYQQWSALESELLYYKSKWWFKFFTWLLGEKG